MLRITHHAAQKNCDGRSRRDFLQIGTLGIGGLSLPLLLEAQAGSDTKAVIKDKSVVVLFLSGGASHIETFNPNMSAPAPYRSVTGEVKTTLPGVTFGGTYPGMARHADQVAVVRSFRHPIGGHVQAIKHVLNGGTDPDGRGQEGISMGSAYTRVRGANDPETGIPTYALLNSKEVDPQYRSERGRVERGSHPGILGPGCAPFIPGSGNGAQKNMQLNIPRARLDDRRMLLRALDRWKHHADQAAEIGAADKYQLQAFDLVLGSAAKVFDLASESRQVIERYDTSMFRVGKKVFRSSMLGRHFLTARKLLEAGSRFITIHSAGWDMHADGNNPGIQAGMEMLGRPMDKAVSAFIEDLKQRGLFEKVLLIITGDFGRTPKINNRGGRDHWPKLCTLAFAGGGITGQLIGRSARDNGEPATDPVDATNLMSTVLHQLFDIGQLRLVRGLPNTLVQVVENGEPIRELV